MRCLFVVLQASVRLETRNLGVMVFNSTLSELRIRCRQDLWRGFKPEARMVILALEDELRAMVEAVGLRRTLEAAMGWSNPVHVETLREIEADDLGVALDRLYASLVLGKGSIVSGTPVHPEFLDAKYGRAVVTPPNPLSNILVEPE